MKYAVGIDIGGTNTRVALIDENYKLVERIQFDTDVENPEVTLKKINDAIQLFDKEIVGIGVSCPGPLDLLHGVVLDTPNLKGGWRNYRIVEEMTKATGLPSFLENDANLAALAEAMVGHGKDLRYVQFLTVSTGLGSGLVIDKQIYQGAHGYANEIANMIMWKDGPSHGSIMPGGIEAISSGTAITARAKAAGLDVKHAGEVNDLAEAGNSKAKAIMEDAKDYLANTLAAIFALIDPEIFILGGSVALKIDGFVEDVEKRTQAKVYKGLGNLVKVVKSDLSEDSGLIGAACLAFNKTV
ncbi:glucokinase [Breznakia sp. PF5-3]|uniref:ROK family protein n=1 Tax=unclassified Breznakia TaxID=2623764 RepID=UPI002405ED04|nr:MULTISPECIES: ROK family protein [unclassified Breznakia]MDF9823851.1 glucokinase [Breznakia sp. PM6-1]MDF9834583.1 glucokinase [Breznakia sp. PF5-3]MDF9836800.1 glucokinase [Breznakia sp. PFB2-8]MDF9858751.1 glucokinase [Breznakia sp. PH5-24]